MTDMADGLIMSESNEMCSSNTQELGVQAYKQETHTWWTRRVHISVLLAMKIFKSVDSEMDHT
jgi:hypothetical protein